MINTDVVIVGAGPVGLYQAFAAGLLGLTVEVLDVLPHAGGQCATLYADKPIYDVPGLPCCTGRELTQRLLDQALPFLGKDRQHLHLGHLVSDLRASETPQQWVLQTDHGLQLQTKAVVLACGVGAFLPRTLALPGLAQARNVHHHLPADLNLQVATPNWRGQHVVVYGGDDEALEAVLALDALGPALRPARITLLHRRATLGAAPQLQARLNAKVATGHIALEVGLPQSVLAEVGSAGQPSVAIAGLELLGADGLGRECRFDQLLIQLGLSPKLGPIQDWGLAMSKKQIGVRADSCETSLSGIHAVGDLNHYEGKKRLLVCGFHEATMAAHAIAARIAPSDTPVLHYTTTSALLHQRLGVEHG